MKEGQTFEGWVVTFLEAVDDLRTEGHDYYSLFGVSEVNTAKVCGFAKDQTEEVIISVTDQLLATSPDVVCWVTTTMRKDEDDEEPALAYVAVFADVDGQVCFLTRRHDHKDDWESIERDDAPWFAISSAVSLSRSLRDKEPLLFRIANDRRLSTTPAETAFDEIKDIITKPKS